MKPEKISHERIANSPVLVVVAARLF
jgi:hypothetical protein